MKERGNGCCSEECSIKQEEKLAKENQKKCADCQTQKKSNELLTIQDQGKEIKICSDCKQKRNNETPPRKDNQLPPKGSCAKCKRRCEMFAKNSQDLGKNNIHCPKCGKDLTGKSYSIISGFGFGKYSDEKGSFARISCGSDCPAEKAEREAQAKEIRDIQEKYKSATDFLSQLKDKLLNPREGATAYNTGNDKAWYDQHGKKWRFCVYVPIWVRYLSKEDAQQVKEKLTPLLNASEKEKDLVLGVFHWLSYKVKYCDRTGYYSFEDNLTGFLAECEEVLAGKVVNNSDQNQTLSAKEKWEKIGQINQEPQLFKKTIEEEISNDFFNTTEDKQELAEIFPASYKHYLSAFYRTTLEAISNVWNKQPKTLQCSKCNKYSSYDNLSLHELYECSAFQSKPSLTKLTQTIINKQLTLLNQLATTLSQLSSNLQGLVNSISNNSNLTSQQKQQALNDVNTNLTDLQGIKRSIDGKLERLRSFQNQTSNGSDKSTNWTPWIIVGSIGGVLVIGIIVYLLKRSKKKP